MEVPVYFRRTVDVDGLGPVVIWGHFEPSPYPEDAAVESDALGRGMAPTRCFSVLCPEGELGLTPVAAMMRVSSEDFLAARARGWA